MTSVTRRRYSTEFKAQAMGLVNNGKPVAEAAQDDEDRQRFLTTKSRLFQGVTRAAAFTRLH
jgi:hypothetical protein